MILKFKDIDAEFIADNGKSYQLVIENCHIFYKLIRA